MTTQNLNRVADDWLAPAGAADYLKVSQRTMKRWRDEKGLPFHRLPGGHVRYLRSDLDEFMAAQRRQRA